MILQARFASIDYCLRTTEQAEGGKVVGVDPALFTACRWKLHDARVNTQQVLTMI